MSDEAPPLIDNNRVLQFADAEDLFFSGEDPILLDGRLVGRVPRLAIAECLTTREIFLHRCDREWTSIAVGVYASEAEARARAERAYPDCASRWRPGRTSHEEAVALRREAWGDLVCSQCGRTPDHVESLPLIADERGGYRCNECHQRGAAD